MNKLGYSNNEARHIYIGEYSEQFEIYKKYHNMEMTKTLFTETEKENEKGEEKLPDWYIPPKKG